MNVPVDVWLRGQDTATTESIHGIRQEPRTWTEDDVRFLLESMLQAMHRLKHPGDAPVPAIALRGLSWIVNPYDGGGVVVAIEITMGAAIAGPLDIDKARLEGMISRVLVTPRTSRAPAVH